MAECSLKVRFRPDVYRTKKGEKRGGGGPEEKILALHISTSMKEKEGGEKPGGKKRLLFAVTLGRINLRQGAKEGGKV